MPRHQGPDDWEWEQRIALIKKGGLTPSPKHIPQVSPPTPPLLELSARVAPPPLELPPPEPSTVTRIQPSAVPAHVRIYSSKTPLLRNQPTKAADCCCTIM
jgi:hypothetical protein